MKLKSFNLKFIVYKEHWCFYVANVLFDYCFCGCFSFVLFGELENFCRIFDCNVLGFNQCIFTVMS